MTYDLSVIHLSKSRQASYRRLLLLALWCKCGTGECAELGNSRPGRKIKFFQKIQPRQCRHFPDTSVNLPVNLSDFTCENLLHLRDNTSVSLTPDWPAQHHIGDSQPHPPHVPRKPNLGRATNPIRTATTRLHGRRIYRRQIHNPPSQAAVANLADLPEKSRRSDCCHRLLHCTYGHVPRAVLLCGLVA